MAFSFVGWLLSVFGWSVARRSFAREAQKSELGYVIALTATMLTISSPAIWMGLSVFVCMAG